MPMPRLKVRRQSSSGMSPILRSSSKIGEDGPGADVDAHAEAFRQNARRIVGDAAAGDVRRAFQNFRVVKGAQRLQITAMQLQ